MIKEREGKARGRERKGRQRSPIFRYQQLNFSTQFLKISRHKDFALRNICDMDSTDILIFPTIKYTTFISARNVKSWLYVHIGPETRENLVN